MFRVAVDLDEVLCPMIRNLSRHYKHTYKKSPPNATPAEYNYARHFGISELESKLLVRSFYSSVHCKTTKPLAGSVEAMRKLKRKYSLCIVTGRQIYGRDATLRFLDTHFDGVFDNVICTNSYSLYGKEMSKLSACKQVDAHVLIDDSVANCNSVQTGGVKGLLYGKYTWNQDGGELDRVDSWENIDDFL